MQLLSTEMGRIEIRLAALNDCPPETARAQFRRCCGSSRWVQRMERARPFASMEELAGCADRIWLACSQDDWLEAFAEHPAIGDRADNQWSRQEQSAIQKAASTTLEALRAATRAYEAKFNFNFILCASGKSADQALALLEQRLNNSPGIELENAAREQRSILQLRLRKMLAE